MTLLSRRELTFLAAAAAVAASSRSYAQGQPFAVPGVKINQLLEQDLQGFSPQTTRLTLFEFSPGSSGRRHIHPVAQEIVYMMDGVLMMDVEGQGTKTLKPGETLLIPAGTIHSPRAENAAKLLIIHSITDKTKPFRVYAKS